VSIDVALFFLGLPAIGTAAATIFLWEAFDPVVRSGFRGWPDATGRLVPLSSVMFVWMLIPALPVVFGVVLWVISLSLDPVVDPTLRAAAAGFGLAGLGAAVGEGLAASRRVADLPRNRAVMGKVLIVMVGLETTFVFALTSSFLIIGALRTIPPPGSLALGTLSLVGLTLGVHGLLALVGGMVVVCDLPDWAPLESVQLTLFTTSS